jgi:PadR family transcriptional regulator AphA
VAGARTDLSLTDWVVLGVIAEEPTHGWAVTRVLAADGELGRVWTVRRPLVYRAITTLITAGLVEECGEQEGTRGPTRTLVRATAAGRRALRRWLDRPVAHVRDVRTELLVKLLLLERAGRPVDALIRRQEAALAPIFAALGARPPADVLGRWRHESAKAVQRFLRTLPRTAE